MDSLASLVLASVVTGGGGEAVLAGGLEGLRGADPGRPGAHFNNGDELLPLSSGVSKTVWSTVLPANPVPSSS